MQIMKTRIAPLLAMVALIVLSSTIDAQNRRTNRSANTNINKNGAVTECGDIRVTYDRRPAITEETQMSLAASQVSTLRA